ncbi:Mitochondrial carrier protein [Fasciola hepatica]|uniref:Mitochondrial carrier protein n=1 Tax=Fasciola hepatica TaxID=6192 RepID=A0A4E0QTZ4_FASHE|nr:Mitochondrial carrier protein [Fasciola hepatica]
MTLASKLYCAVRVQLSGWRSRGSATGMVGYTRQLVECDDVQPIITMILSHSAPSRLRSMTHAALYITSHEGVSGFFRGLVPSLLLVAPQTGLQFAIYHTFNRLVETVYDSWNKTKDRRNLNTLSEETQTISGTTKDNTHVFNVGPVLSLVSGGLAGMGSKCVIYPLDMVKKRMQIQGFEEGRTGFGRVPTSRGMCDCLMKIWTTEGAVALFKGLRPTLLKSCVSISCRFTVYEQVCQLIYHLRHESTSGRTF